MNTSHSSKIPLWESNQKNNNLNQYKNWLTRKNLTTETIKIKLKHVRQFDRELTTDNIVDFLKENAHYTPYHLENLRNSLLSYAKFLKIHDEIEWDIVNKVIPRIQPKPFPIIDKNELEKLKSANNLKHKKNNNECDNLILDFFLNTGLRISELVNIKHCHYEDNLLKVLGKGNKFRFVPLPKHLAQHFNHSDGYLFQTKTGKSLHPSQIRSMIYQRNKKANLNKHISPHTFRRSFATLLDKNQVRLTTIQKLLGHSDINTTSNYIQNSYQAIIKEAKEIKYKSPNNLNKKILVRLNILKGINAYLN